MSDIKTAELQALEAAYIALLRMPHGLVRSKNQHALCALRYAISEETNIDSEEVQSKYEAIAVAPVLLDGECELPPLPTAFAGVKIYDEDPPAMPLYTADQMRAYALQARAAVNAPPVDAQKVRDEAGWFLRESALNKPMLETFLDLLKHAKRGRWTNAVVRKDSVETSYEADWIKHLQRVESQPAAPLSNGGEAKPFMYAIQEPSGEPYFDELCVSGLYGDLDETVDSLNEGHDYSDGEGYKAVPVYLHPPKTPSKPQLSDSEE